MKNVLIFLIALCSTTSAVAQNCKGYYYLLENAEVEMTILDANGKPGGKTVYHVTAVRNTGGTTESDFTNTFYDKNNKAMSASTGHFKCSSNGVAIDMKVSVPVMPQMKDMKMEGTSNAALLDYPAGMHVGQELQGGTFELQGNMSGMEVGISYTISNRKVVGQESITTTAGTWNCFKITYDLNFQMKMMGKGIPMKINATEWFAPDFGAVKTASMKDGKNMGGTLITALKK
ncbi:hypothetical protein SAMN05444266_10919 [Chitinophaga jiangningensis]|uniref:DUF3108 domain-containing protein n=1 Tax=Chitinophaga jiangningensis TaxID=1419482 RepID=A0A1M7JV51_9BACT|nr:hypothetical protein [Chitinophaga jiangningensis]SHM56417.1 hypothetical protein SAMN05444266_10919 [Chitinophaga jiangningensis]